MLAASDLERKQALLRQAEEATVMTRLMCDLLVGARSRTTTGKPPQDDERSRVSGQSCSDSSWRPTDTMKMSIRGAAHWKRCARSQAVARRDAARFAQHRTFHWPLEFPEVFCQSRRV